METYYIRILITPTLTYLRTSLQTSLQIYPKQKASRKMTSLRSGVRMGLMKKNTFKKLIWANVIILLIFLVKLIFYPYALAPDDLSKAMLLYEELLPLVDNFVLIFFLLAFIAFIVSLYLLYKFNDYGRQLFIVTNIIGILFVFSDGYVVFDSFDYFLDSIATALVGFTIAISYFSSLSKEFKKKK